MHELNKLLDYVNSVPVNQPLILASVVDVSGSAYRRPGAHMLFSLDGGKVGTISAGCLEADLFERLPELSAQGTPQLLRYENGADDLFQLNMGCEGAIDLLVEPYDRHSLTPISAFKLAQESGETVYLATVLQSADESLVGFRMLLNDEAPKLLLGIEDLFSKFVELDLQHHIQCLGEYKIAFERIEPPLELYICGAGDDTQPLLHYADRVGLDVTVYDHRCAFADSLRKTCPQTVVHWNRKEPLPISAKNEKRAAVVIMSHNYEVDKEFLAMTAPLGIPYIGLMGPKRRTERMLEELAADGVRISSQLFYPIGLDICAENAEEIALSITAEILAVFRNTRAGFLKDKIHAIHAATAQRESCAK